MENLNLVKSQEGDITIYTAKGTRITDPQQIIDDIGLDPTREYVSDKEARAFEGQQKGPDGKPTILQMWSVAVKIKALFTPQQEVLLDVIENYIPPVWEGPKIEPLTNLLGINYISDMHIGKYDLKGTSIVKQEKKIIKAINTATDRMYNMGSSRFGQYYLGDDVNSDGNSKTTKGTEQHNVARERDQMESWLNVIGETTDYSSKLGPTELKFIKGNHNKTLGEIMGMFAKRLYENHPNVEYDGNTDAIQFKKYGEVGLGLFHGDTIKGKDIIPLIHKNLKGIKVAEGRHGHVHRNEVKQENGGQIISNSALCPESERTTDYNVGRDYNKLSSAVYDTKGRVADLFTRVE